eukprot:4774833-Prymnesium_polylepis.1
MHAGPVRAEVFTLCVLRCSEVFTHLLRGEHPGCSPSVYALFTRSVDPKRAQCADARSMPHPHAPPSRQIHDHEPVCPCTSW